MLKTKILILLVITFLTATFVNAQDPTLAETLDYIKSKVNNSGCRYRAFYDDAERYDGVKYDIFYDQIDEFYNKINFEEKNAVVEQTIKLIFKSRYNDPEGVDFENGEFKSNNIYKLNLADLDSAKVISGDYIKHFYSEKFPFLQTYHSLKANFEGRCYFVRLNTFDKEGKILATIDDQYLMLSKLFGYSYGKEQKHNGLLLFFPDEDTTTRVAKAFTHAIKLSGGKKELF